MKFNTRIAIISTACLCSTAPALAASDYFLKIEGVDGEAASSIDILSYSWGMSNPSTMSSGTAGAAATVAPAASTSTATTSTAVAPAPVAAPRDAASGQATGRRSSSQVKVTASQNSQSLRESPTRASTGGTAVVAGDLDGDGRADFIDAALVPEVDGFKISVDKSSPILAKLCANGTHIPKATIVARGQEMTIENAAVSGCAAGASPPATTNGAPNRISVNVTVPRQTQGATFGERCTAGACPEPEQVTLTITGQMKHTKSGHVTLLK